MWALGASPKELRWRVAPGIARRSGAATREPVREVRLLQKMMPKAVVMFYDDGTVFNAESGEFAGKAGYLGYF